MDVTGYINMLIEHLRQAGYPEALINALSLYLLGLAPLSQVQQEWQAAQSLNANPSPSPIIPADIPADALDELDQRRQDIRSALDRLNTMLASLSQEAPVAEFLRYLQRHLEAQKYSLDYVIAGYYGQAGNNALRYLLLRYQPHNLLAMLPLTKQYKWASGYEKLLELLASAQPPYLDLAWHAVQHLSPGSLGYCVAPLLKADPARFREWARQVASPGGPGTENDQVEALLALFAHDIAHNTDLAEAIAAGKRAFRLSGNGWRVQLAALEALYNFDPAKYAHLLDAAIASKEYSLYDRALGLLKNADPAQARPILQHAVAAGTAQAAARAARQLLETAWDGRQSYALSLLSHHCKQVRDLAIDWLLPQGEALVEQVRPLLADRSAHARLAAVEVLVRLHLGTERTRALLAGRLEVEKSVSVKQAIVDAIGLPEPPADLDPDTTTAALQDEAASSGKQSPLRWFAAEEPTDLRWVSDAPVPPSVINYLLACQARARQMQLEMNARRILYWLDRQTTGELALTLFTGWAKQGGNARESWLLPLIAALGDDRLVQYLRKQVDLLSRKGKWHTRAARIVQTLALIGSDLALTEISDLARYARHRSVQQAAREAFAEAASQQNLSPEELADRIAPRLGFDEKGEQIFDFGPRQFSARLGFDLSVHLKDTSGKRLTLLPRANARDDAAKVAAAQAAWQVLKKHLAPAIKIQTERLENALSTQRVWAAARWRELFLRHPLLRAIAINLVWGVMAPDGSGYTILFRPLEDGTLTTADDEACALPDEGFVRLVHPIELDEGARGAWLQHLSDYEITPPFPQLNRPIITADEAARQGIWWEQYRGYRVPGKLFKERYQRSGWEPGEERSMYSYNLIWKAFPAAGIEALLESSYLVLGHEQGSQTTIIRLGFGRAGTVERIKQAAITDSEGRYGAYDYQQPFKVDEAALLKLADIPPVVFSEAAASVQAFAALGHYDPG